MRRPILMTTAALLCLIAVGLVTDSTTKGQSDETKPAEPPVRNWSDWWPSTQFNKGDAVSPDQVAKAPIDFDGVNYGGIATPWGTAYANFNHDQIGGGLCFDLSFSGPGTMDDEGWAKHKSPEEGDVTASIWHKGNKLQDSKNAPMIMAWAGGGLGTTGTMMIFFDWLPVEMEDYWIQINVLKERHWFLIPYGLGCPSEKALDAPTLKIDGPTKPAKATENDHIHSWGSVSYELGKSQDGKRRVSATVSNPFDTEISICIYEDSARWEINSPRTSAVFNWPGGYPRFCTWTSINRVDSSYSRYDRYKFWRSPNETRGWGLLRVTVEDEVFEIAVPTSLFFYTHGHVDSD